jgi:AcrR family transcriptional regulator
MRKVGERLGTSAMALYTYVPGKTELLEVMFESVLGELPPAYPTEDGWRPAAEACAQAGWELYERHPWVLQISAARALLAPNELDSHEAQLRIYDGVGLSAFEITRVVGAVSSYVRGAAKAVADARASERATGMSDDEWWEVRSALLEEFGDFDWAERFPTTARLAAEHAFEQLHREPDDPTPYMEREALDDFEFGLARLLDGVEALIERRQREQRAATKTSKAKKAPTKR